MRLSLLFLSLLLIAGWVTAEPWLSNRYSQNCAACHAPGRVNKAAPGRRCTLSCQGCHVNPQGGGMRNQYGVWTQQRWLRSVRTQLFRDKATPFPLNGQPYKDRVESITNHASTFYGGKRSPRAQETKASGSASPEKRTIKGIPNLRLVRETTLPESYFDKYSYDGWRAVVESEKDFLSVIPKGDPYRLERELGVYAGGDLRYLVAQSSEANLSGQKARSWLMAADIGARLRPTKYHSLSAVIEARFENAPNNQDPEDGFTSGAHAKSAYLLLDDLAYNSFLQAGLYRPMFGHYDPDHNSLSNDISGLTQKVFFKGFAAGVAPNVPFFIVNYLQPYSRTGAEYATSSGVVGTVGLRFVSYGASATISYWDTKYISGNDDNKRQMYSATLGGRLGPLIANLEFLRARVTSSNGANDAGNVTTAQTKFRVWRENYLEFNYATSNVARDLTAGNGSELMAGARSFLISNVDFELLYVMRKDTISDTTTTSHLWQFQTHIFF